MIKSFKIFPAVQRSSRHHSWIKVTDQPCQTDWICANLGTSEQNNQGWDFWLKKLFQVNI